jgi:hypothetical protein
LLEAARVRYVYKVEASAILSPGRLLSEDEVTDLIDVVIDALDMDANILDPSVSTAIDGDGVRITVSVNVDSQDQFTALATAANAMESAFTSAGVAKIEGMPGASDLRSEVRLLQAV